MGTSDGYVSGLVKVHDAGAPADRFNLIFVAEGYQVGELAQFAADIDDITARLFTFSPFDEDAVACALNIYRLDVVSDDSGADKPDCDDPSRPAIPVSTSDSYFDGTFCPGGDIWRLVGGDNALVQSTVETYLPEWTQIIVVVNDSQRGGAGGSIAWTTTGGTDWREVAIHEMGHSAFGLADEYDYRIECDEDGQDTYAGAEPMEPNVTIEPDPALVKWSAFVTGPGDAPTMPNPDCGDCNNGPSPVAAGIVGTFEGARYFHCGVYRPQYECMMRDTADIFCAVCIDEIRDTMAAYAVPATTGAVMIDTLSVSFDDIPEETSTVRPVVFSVDTCLPVTFEVTAAPSAPFSVAYDPIVVSSPGGSTVRLARVWIRYDCAAAGTSDTDSVTIRLVETGQTWVVPLSGNCVPRETAAVQLVLDRSGSMLGATSEGRIKADVLRDSARVLADVAYDDTGLGANTYDHDAHPLMNITVAGASPGGAGRTTLRDKLTNEYAPNPLGDTATGDGIEFARTQLDAATAYDAHAMIVLTDGQDTASKTVGEVADGVINQRVFAIGLGTAQQINPQTLQTLAGATGGYMLMTGLLTQDDTFLLEKYYLQILAGVTNNDIILDPEGYLSRAAPEVRIPFDVAEADIEISAITLATFTLPVNAALEAPDGTLYTEADAAADPSLTYSKSQDSILMRASLPLVSGGQPQREGRWHLVLRLDIKAFVRLLQSIPEQVPDNVQSSDAFKALVKLIEQLRQHGVKYSAVVQTYSNLNLAVDLVQSSYEPGAQLTLSARLTEYGGPFFGSATVAVDVTRPDGALVKVPLSHAGEGEFGGSLTASQQGLYSARYRANGTTQRGRPFTREQLRTASVWTGGDRPVDVPGSGTGSGTGGGGGNGGGVVDLLCCLLRHDGLGGQFDEFLKKTGIDPDTFRRCLEELCKEREAGRQVRSPTTLASVGLTQVQAKALESRLDELTRSIMVDLTR